MTPEEIRAKFPDEWDKKIKDPYAHRYPRAESYHDLSIRLEPIIFELERATSDVLIVGQSSVLRCLIAYLQGRRPQDIPYIQIKEGELYEMAPKAYGVSTRVIGFWNPVMERRIRDQAYFRERQLNDDVSRSQSKRVSLFRPCIDIHEGKVKQIVGGTWRDAGKDVKTNFVAQHSPAHYAHLYRQHGLTGAHMIKLGPRNDDAAIEALRAWPGGLQVGGGISDANAQDWILKGASKVIVTSYLFPHTKFSLDRLKSISSIVGKDQLVVDVSCRRRQEENVTKWVVAMNRWQDLTDMEINEQSLKLLSQYCSEFLIHAADVEGLCQGIDEELVTKLSEWVPDGCATTYAGGARHLGDLELVNRLSLGKVDLTFGSALDIFGGSGVALSDLMHWNRGLAGQYDEEEHTEDEGDDHDSTSTEDGKPDASVENMEDATTKVPFGDG